MNPHPRIRRTIKWGAAAVTVLLVVGWIGSGRGGFFVSDSHGRGAGVHAGSMVGQTCRYFSVGSPIDYGLFPRGEWHLDLWSWKFVGDGNGWAMFIPLWAPAASALLITSAAWRLDALAFRREQVGRCPKCDYDRAGLAAGAVCPECGMKGNAKAS